MFHCVQCDTSKLESELAVPGGDICFPCMDAYATRVNVIYNRGVPPAPLRARRGVDCVKAKLKSSK